MKIETNEINRLRSIIRYEVRARGLNYRILSEATGMSYLKVRRILTSQEPKLIEFLKILKFLEIDIFKLFDESDQNDQINSLYGTTKN